MSTDGLATLLRALRRQLTMIRVVRVAGLLLFAAAILWAAGRPEPANRHMLLFTAAAAMLAAIMLLFHSARLAQEVRTASVLLRTGQLDDAEAWLRRAIERFALSRQAKLLAGQQLASLFSRRDAHSQVVAICQELLRHPARRLRNVWINTRLLLADSLLMLDRVNEAYEALRPLYDSPLSLADRTRLLPIQLRYELASGHAASAVQALAEKVRIAELLDSPRAALVHALLAEACRRQAMPEQHGFLAERARLYHDLGPLAKRYTAIAPIAPTANAS